MNNQLLNVSTATFSYTGTYQTFTVPTDVTTLTIAAYGAQGGSTEYSTGGYGGQMSSTIKVTSGQTLYVYIGGQGAVGSGGYNGGGSPSQTTYAAAGGGGATDIRSKLGVLTSRLVVAGGGGGAGYNGVESVLKGGYGGYPSGGQGTGDGFGFGGYGGSQISGGAGGYYNIFYYQGSAGTLGTGGAGAYGTNGGGGGGGYYGGGGGAWNAGGGGSSYTSGTILTYSNGINLGNGYMSITYSSSYTLSKIVLVLNFEVSCFIFAYHRSNNSTNKYPDKWYVPMESCRCI